MNPQQETRTIWLAWTGEYDDRDLIGIFDTELGALRALDGMGNGQRIEQREVSAS